MNRRKFMAGAAAGVAIALTGLPAEAANEWVDWPELQPARGYILLNTGAGHDDYAEAERWVVDFCGFRRSRTDPPAYEDIEEAKRAARILSVITTTKFSVLELATGKILTRFAKPANHFEITSK